MLLGQWEGELTASKLICVCSQYTELNFFLFWLAQNQPPACLGISNSLYHCKSETEPSRLSSSHTVSQTVILCSGAVAATAEIFFSFTTLPSKKCAHVSSGPFSSFLDLSFAAADSMLVYYKLAPKSWLPPVVPYSCPVRDHEFRLSFTMLPSYLWNLMMQKFSCKYCMLKQLNLSHLFPHQSCSQFSILLVEELPTSESHGAKLHGGDQLTEAAFFSIWTCVSTEVSWILKSVACHAPTTSSRACGSYWSPTPNLALLLALVGTEESGSIFREEK